MRKIFAKYGFFIYLIVLFSLFVFALLVDVKQKVLIKNFVCENKRLEFKFCSTDEKTINEEFLIFIDSDVINVTTAIDLSKEPTLHEENYFCKQIKIKLPFPNKIYEIKFVSRKDCSKTFLFGVDIECK